MIATLRFTARRAGLTLPETVGVMACLGIGLVSGCWLFGGNFSELFKLAAASKNSTPASVAETTESPRQHPLESIQANRQAPVADSHKAYPVDSEIEATESAIGVDRPIDRAEVQALLGETSPAPRQRIAKPNPTQATSQRAHVSGERTLAYWNDMNRVMAEEESMRTPPVGGITPENAADFIARRGEAGNFAATELRGLDTTGVDPAVVALNGDIAAWYARGTKLNDRASYLLNQASDSTRRGQTGRAWGNSEKSHNASVAEINAKGDALRQEISKKYGIIFPDLR